MGILVRQVAAVAVVILLYTAAVPFTPYAWIFNVEGSGFILDRFLAGITLICAAYFQWRIASLRFPLAVTLPGTSGQAIQGGRVRQADHTLFVWNPANYWPCLALEIALLCVAEWGVWGELARRSIISGVVFTLWLVGLPATPESTKRWAWEQMKQMWLWMVLDEVLNTGRRHGPSRRRRRW